MAKINLPVKCNQCGKELSVNANIDPTILAPSIRGNLRPVGIPYEYRVTSEDIIKFITDTINQYAPDAQLKVVAKYCEKRRRKESEPQRSYAFFKIAFSHHVIKNYAKDGWFQQLGESGDNVLLIESVYNNIIQRWSYDRKYLNEWIKSYKKMERLEDRFGMTDAFLYELKQFSSPRGVKVTGGSDLWVFFAASPEKILKDFFTNPETGELAGKLSVDNPIMISKDVIEYRITVNPYKVESVINPHVQQILNGEEKFDD